MATALNLHEKALIGGRPVTFARNPEGDKGCLATTTLMLKTVNPVANLMKGIRDTSQLMLQAGLTNHVIEHWNTLSGYAFAALAAPYWITVLQKLKESIEKGEYGLKFSRHLTEAIATFFYGIAAWIPGKSFPGALASVGKILMTYPYVIDLQENVHKLQNLKKFESDAKKLENHVSDDKKRALGGSIRETWYKIGKLALGLLATLAVVFSILTGIMLPLVVTMGVLVASVGSVVLDLMASQVRASEPLLAI